MIKMAYIVRIQVGKGKEKSVSQSIELNSKADVSRYVRKHPFGNSKTHVEVEDLDSGEISKGQKIHFSNPSRW